MHRSPSSPVRGGGSSPGRLTIRSDNCFLSWWRWRPPCTQTTALSCRLPRASMAVLRHLSIRGALDSFPPARPWWYSSSRTQLWGWGGKGGARPSRASSSWHLSALLGLFLGDSMLAGKYGDLLAARRRQILLCQELPFAPSTPPPLLVATCVRNWPSPPQRSSSPRRDGS